MSGIVCVYCGRKDDGLTNDCRLGTCGLGAELTRVEFRDRTTAPVDPSTPEREARENVTMCYHPSDFSEAEFLDRLDAYAAAVRSRALADVAGWVEGMVPLTIGSYGIATDEGIVTEPASQYVSRAAILAKLREAK